MVKFEVEMKQKLIMNVRKALADFAKVIENQTSYISITEKEIRFYNMIPNMNHDFHLRASLVFYFDEIAEKKNISIKDKSKEINITLNKVSEVINTLNFSQYYNEMTMKLVKDSLDKRSLRLKFFKQDSLDMVYINDCGIEFTNIRYQHDLKTQFEFEVKSFYLKGLMDLSKKLEENIIFKFNFNDEILEVSLPSQNMSMSIACIYTKKSSSLEGVPSMSYELYHKFCRRLTQSVNFEGPLKFGMSSEREMYVDTELLSGTLNEEGLFGKFRFIIPVMEIKIEGSS